MTWSALADAAAWVATHSGAVETIIRTVIRTTVEPLYGRLTREQVAEKSPGEIVTAADLRAEGELGVAFTGLLSRVCRCGRGRAAPRSRSNRTARRA